MFDVVSGDRTLGVPYGVWGGLRPMDESESRSEEHSVISPASASTVRITCDNGLVALGPLSVVAGQEAGEAGSVVTRWREERGAGGRHRPEGGGYMFGGGGRRRRQRGRRGQSIYRRRRGWARSEAGVSTERAAAGRQEWRARWARRAASWSGERGGRPARPVYL